MERWTVFGWISVLAISACGGPLDVEGDETAALDDALVDALSDDIEGKADAIPRPLGRYENPFGAASTVGWLELRRDRTFTRSLGGACATRFDPACWTSGKYSFSSSHGRRYIRFKNDAGSLIDSHEYRLAKRSLSLRKVGGSRWELLRIINVESPFGPMPAICSSGRMSRAQAAQRLRAGENAVTLGDARIWRRSRSCHVASGCGAWTEDPQRPDANRMLVYLFFADYDGEVLISAGHDDCGRTATNHCGAIGGALSCSVSAAWTSYAHYSGSCTTSTIGDSYGNWAIFKGDLVEDCLRLTASIREPNGMGAEYGDIETEWVVFLAF